MPEPRIGITRERPSAWLAFNSVEILEALLLVLLTVFFVVIVGSIVLLRRMAPTPTAGLETL